MQGVVSNTGGTEAGVFPKYKNDIYLLYKKLNHVSLLLKLKLKLTSKIVDQILYQKMLNNYVAYLSMQCLLNLVCCLEIIQYIYKVYRKQQKSIIQLQQTGMEPQKGKKPKIKYIPKQLANLKNKQTEEKKRDADKKQNQHNPPQQRSRDKQKYVLKDSGVTVSSMTTNQGDILKIASQASRIPEAPKPMTRKIQHKIKKNEFNQESLEPVSGKLEENDIRQLKKSLINVISNAESINIMYNPYKPIIVLSYYSKSVKDYQTLKDLMQANSHLKKKKEFIQRIYSSLYRQVPSDYFSIGFFGIETAYEKRINFRNKNFNNKYKRSQYSMFYCIKNQNFYFILFDFFMNGVQFNTNNIKNLEKRLSKQYKIYQSFAYKMLKNQGLEQMINQTFGQQEVDSDEEQRSKRIEKQKKTSSQQLLQKINNILQKDITQFEQNIQEKSERVNELNKKGGQKSQIQKLSEEVMEQNNSLQNFIQTRDDVIKKLKLKSQMNSNQQQVKLLKSCLKRMILAQKQLESRLPIISRKRQIFEQLKKSNLLILEGETGSGKSTQLPQILCEFYKIFQNQDSLPVLITQPRKLATRTLAERVASEMEEQIHDFVDYQTSLVSDVNKNAKIIFKMDRLVLDELKIDPKLSKYCCLVIDQAHQRTISIDVILGLIQKLLTLRSDFKIIVTSASMDIELFRKYFKSRILKVSGRMFPVQEIFNALQSQKDTVRKIIRTINEQILNENEQNLRQKYQGHVLVFCSGVDQIQQLCKYYLNKLNKRVFKVLALHGKLTPQQQKQVFRDCQEYKIIFASRIAQTSITIDKVKVVIDPGQDRQMVYDQKNKVTSMKLKKISQSSAKQRAGRAGRTNKGFCFRLYSAKQKNQLILNKVPEINNMALETVVLRLKSLQIQDIVNFPYLTPPSKQGLLNSIQLMKMLSCLDESTEKISPIGEFLVKIPIQPFLARAIFEAMLMQKNLREKKDIVAQLKMDGRQIQILSSTNLVQQVIRILCLIISASNLFYVRQQDRQKADKQKFQKLKDEEGDFFFLQNIYRQYLKYYQDRQGDKLRKWARDHYINLKTLNQARELQKQIMQIIMFFKVEGEIVQRNMIEALVKLTEAKTVNQALLSCLVSSFATNLALSSFNSRNNQIIGYTVVSNELPIHIYGSSILCLQGICPKWILFYDLYENEKGQMYCKIANSIDYQFLKRNTNPYILKKFNIQKAEKINPYYDCIIKKLPSLIYQEILHNYQKRFYQNAKQFQFMDKFHINFDEDHNSVEFFYRRKSFQFHDILKISPFISALKQKMRNLIPNTNYLQSNNPEQIIDGYIKQIKDKFSKPLTYNYIGHIYIILKSGFELVRIDFQVVQHVYRFTAPKQHIDTIFAYCNSLGTFQVYDDSKVVVKINQQENRVYFQSTIQQFKYLFKINDNFQLKIQHQIQDIRKKVPQSKLYMHFWAGQAQRNNTILLKFDDNVNLQQIVKDLQNGAKKLSQRYIYNMNQNKLLGLNFRLTKKGNAINCTSRFKNSNQMDQIELFEILQTYNKEQKFFSYSFKMPKYIKKFRDPDLTLSIRTERQWEAQIRKILRRQGLSDDKISIRVWGRPYYTKQQQKKLNSIQKTRKVELHAEIKSLDFIKLREFQAQNDKKIKVIGTQKVHLKFEFQQIAVVTASRTFAALRQQYDEIIDLVSQRYPLITIEYFERQARRLTKVYIKVRGSNRDELIWPVLMLSDLFKPRLIPLSQAKFRFVDRMDMGNNILEQIEALYKYKIYFAMEKKTHALKIYCKDSQLQPILQLLQKRLNEFKIYQQQISYRGKNLNRVKQICDKKLQQLDNKKNKAQFFSFDILFKFRKIRITGDINTCDQVKNRIMAIVNKQKQQCTICSCLFQNQYRLFDCQHEFCLLCLASYVRQSINNVNQPLLNCPSCQKLINVQDVRKIMSPEEFNKFCDTKISRKIEKDDNYHACFSANCQNIFLKRDSIQESCFECDLCGKWYCFKCKQSHKSYNCMEWKQYKDQNRLNLSY